MSAPDFQILPAIDLLGGRCVRLTQGRYEDATVYDDDPAGVAAGFVSAGVRRIHVVDLDGAKRGEAVNRPAVRAITTAAGEVPVQMGGGVRDLAAVEAALELGVERVILGTVALRDPPLVLEAARRFEGHVAVGIDARDGFVSVEGWLETSEARAVDVAKRFEDAGVVALVYTDIARDGMLEGPNFEATGALADAVGIPVVLSGGVASEDDLVEAARLAPRGVCGAIVGRALYTGRVDLARAVGRVREASACS